MKPPVEAPTSSAIRPAGSISNASSAAASLCPPRLTYGRRFRDGQWRVRRDQVARLAVEAGRVALPHPDLARQHQRLRPTARLDQPALDEQLVEPDARRLDSLVGSSRRRGAHPPIVAQPASPGLTGRLRARRGASGPTVSDVALSGPSTASPCHATIRRLRRQTAASERLP